MSSIWSNAATSAGASPFGTSGIAPTPGGGAAAKFQSALQSAGKSGHAGTQLGLSPKAASAAGAHGTRSAASGTGGTSGTSGTSGSGDADDAGASITANDFLTLLVTEMQNQDPTADVDPNAYIDQLVQINSLEQLISINQNLSEVLGAASPPATSSAAGAGNGSAAAAGASAVTGKAVGKGSAAASSAPSIRSSEASGPGERPMSKGNLSAPKPSAASGKVSHALDGHTRPVRSGHAFRDIPTHSLAP